MRSIGRRSPRDVALACARRTSRWASASCAVELARRAIGGEARRDRLEVAATVAAPLAGRAVGVDDDVPELGPAAVEAAVEDDAPTDPGPEREGDEVRASPRRRRASTRRARPRWRRSRCRPGRRTAHAMRPAMSTSSSGRFVARNATPVTRVEVHRHADADGRRTVAEQVRRRDRRSRRGSTRRDRPGSAPRSCVRSCRRARRRPRGSSSPRGRRRSRCPAPSGGYHTRPHGHGRQAVPRVQGRSVEGPCPAPAADPAEPGRSRRDRAGPDREARPSARGRSAAPPPDRERWIVAHARRRFSSSSAVWGVLSRRWRSRRGVERGERRGCPAASRRSSPSVTGCSSRHPRRTLLVLGTDGGVARARRRNDRTRSCSSAPTPAASGSRTSRSRATCRSSIPDYGVAKINAASQVGGPAACAPDGEGRDRTADQPRRDRRLRPVQGGDRRASAASRSTSLRRSGRSGSTVRTHGGEVRDVARLAIREGARRRWTGRRALVYSRIRVNELDPAETDFDRTRRQQQVVQATLDKATSVGTALRLPFAGDELVQAARDRPLHLGAPPARLGVVPRRRGRRRALPSRRRSGDRRRRVGDPALGGQRRGGRDVHGPGGAAAAPQGAALRAGLQGRGVAVSAQSLVLERRGRGGRRVGRAFVSRSRRVATRAVLLVARAARAHHRPCAALREPRP